MIKLEARALRAAADDARAEVRLRGGGAQLGGRVVHKGECDRSGRFGGQSSAEAIADVDHGAARRRFKEPPLGGEVLLDGAMKVEVVLGQVGEDRAGESEAVGAVKGKCMRGDLHRAGAAAAGNHLSKRAI